jgi:hypothetical protein
MAKYVLFLFFILLAIPSSGQNHDSQFVTIKGKAISQFNKEPVENVEICLRLDDQVSYSAITGTDGNYSLRVKKFKGTAALFAVTSKKTTSKTTAKGGFLPCKILYTVNLKDKKQYAYDFDINPVVD